MIHEMGLAEKYGAGMAKAAQTVRELGREIGVDANYLIPFAFRSGTLYKMHLAEVAYIVELRSKPQGHFSYREIACQMHDQLVKRFPILKGQIRVTPFSDSNPLTR